MDACDPGIDYKNLKSLIKQNTGHDLKLSRKQICEVYSTTQDGKLPLPPLILSSDRTFLLDKGCLNKVQTTLFLEISN